MMLRRASSLLIAVLLLFSLCAFGQQRNRPPSPAPTASPAEPSAKAAAPSAAEAKAERAPFQSLG